MDGRVSVRDNFAEAEAEPMGWRNLNCKKKWHPSRHETRSRVEAGERVQQETEREAEQRRSEEPACVPEKGTGRMPWMVEGFDKEEDKELRNRFEL